jgi:prepilin-type N-terminal cleavage/methylation domain-containing protein
VTPPYISNSNKVSPHQGGKGNFKSFYGFRQRAFTLIELLVVIAIIAILAAILLPVLGHAKQAAWRVQCANSLHQLTLGWIMYNQDNSGNFPYNVATGSSSGINWVASHESYADDPASSNATALVNSSVSLLGPYASNYKVYKCPADQSCIGNTTSAPWHGLSGPQRVRSYSMSQAIGGNTNGTVFGANLSTEVQGSWLGGSGGSQQSPDTVNTSVPGSYTVYLKESMMRGALGPADLIVLVEEHPDSINDCAWAFEMPANPSATYWIDKPSSLHEDACDFSFADGHCEIHAFQDPGDVPQVTYAQQIGGIGYNTKPKDPDVIWVASHTSVLWHP